MVVDFSLESFLGFFEGELAVGEAGGLDEITVGKDELDAVDVVHDAPVFLGEFVARGVGDEATDGFARVGVDGEGEAVRGESGIELAEGDASLDVDEAVVSVELADVVHFFHGDDEAVGEVGTGFREAGAADGDGEAIVFFGELGSEADDFADVGSGFWEGDEARSDFEHGAVGGVSFKNSVFVEDVAGEMAIQINRDFIHNFAHQI